MFCILNTTIRKSDLEDCSLCIYLIGGICIPFPWMGKQSSYTLNSDSLTLHYHYIQPRYPISKNV